MFNLVSPSIGPRRRLICCRSMSIEARVAHWLPAGNKGAPTTKISAAGRFTDAETFAHCSADITDLVPVPSSCIAAVDEMSMDERYSEKLLLEMQTYAGGTGCRAHG